MSKLKYKVVYTNPLQNGEDIVYTDDFNKFVRVFMTERPIQKDGSIQVFREYDGALLHHWELNNEVWEKTS